MLIDPDDDRVIGAQNLWRFGRRPAWTAISIIALLAVPFVLVWGLHVIHAPSWLG